MTQNILIIDDEEHDRKGMVVALKREGFHDVCYADSAGKGLEMVKTIKPDVVIIDVVLRETDGFDVCMKIREVNEVDPKIIMITGHLDAVNAQKARVSGANEIIEKVAGFSNIGNVIKGLS